jgi:RHS repeat-associated protein
VLYNSLGMLTEINLHNGVTTTYEYWGIDETGGYYGRLWNINTNDGSTDLIDIEYTWDAAGNLLTREDVIAEETETFTYDFLDRLLSVSGPYTESFTYDEIGNITSRNGISYTYGNQPHAVTSVGSTSYTYDANGNMVTRGSQTIDWDVENRVISVSGGASFVYDGDGNRMMKTENGETILYVNRYYEKNLTTGEVTTYYYLGGQLVAMRQGDDLKYMHQDHLTSTSVMTDDSGDSLGAIKYLPFGETRSGSVPTDKQFTGQRLDDTGLYYYNARYYDPTIGRFISADPIITRPWDPQSFNRYSYCLNNPLKYIDPSGHTVEINGWDVEVIDAMLQIVHLLPTEIQQALAEVINSPEYQAYMAFRNSEEGAAQAAKLEELDETVNIEFGETNHPFQDSLTQVNNGEYIITINQDIINANDFYIVGAILGASYDIVSPDLIRDLRIFTTNILHGAADFLQSFVSPGYGSAPLDHLIAVIQTTGARNPAAAVVVGFGYLICAYGANWIHDLADWIAP